MEVKRSVKKYLRKNLQILWVFFTFQYQMDFNFAASISFDSKLAYTQRTKREPECIWQNRHLLATNFPEEKVTPIFEPHFKGA